MPSGYISEILASIKKSQERSRLYKMKFLLVLMSSFKSLPFSWRSLVSKYEADVEFPDEEETMKIILHILKRRNNLLAIVWDDNAVKIN